MSSWAEASSAQVLPGTEIGGCSPAVCHHPGSVQPPSAVAGSDSHPKAQILLLEGRDTGRHCVIQILRDYTKLEMKKYLQGHGGKSVVN